jgi:inner membrane protein
MASAFSHILVALAVGQIQPWKKWPMCFWSLSLLCSLLPDVDVVGFAMGIPYEHLLGHRGLTHSLSFAVAVDLVVVRLGFPSAALGCSLW